jgi:serine/alanine adding enzyme
MQIETIEEPGDAWDDFVLQNPDATLGHAAGWCRVLRSAYRLAPAYLVARGSSSGIEGVLPLVTMRGLRGEKELVSLPYLDSAGVLASSQKVADALLDHALGLARKQGARAVELRALRAEGTGPGPLDRVDLVMSLESDVDAQWQAVRAKVRNQTRKAEREGLALIELGATAQIDAFYAPFTVNMRDLGSPVHSLGFFREIARVFGDAARFIVTGLAGDPVGGLVAIRFGDTVTIPWASTLRSERARCPNNQIYWEALRWSVEQGARHLDFGRSPRDGGTHRFKLGWGAHERELDWRRLAPDGEARSLALPGGNPALKRLSSLWTRLPVPLATLLGPHLRRRISS